MSRWVVLWVLFFVRTGMGFQYQTPAAIGPLLQSQFGLPLDQFGLLVGLYFFTGLGLAIPSAALGSVIDEKKAVTIGLILMIAGALWSSFASGWGGLVGGRLLAGTGGVLINVLLTKIVADWFSEGGLANAMAIFVNSWPVGIAIALLVVPFLGVQYGTTGAFLAGAIWALAALVLIQIVPSTPARQLAGSAEWPSARNGLRVLLAGLVWAFWNAAFVIVFSFGPAMLRDDGFSLITAGGVISLVMWFSIVGVFAGGVLADRLRQPGVLITSVGLLLVGNIVLASGHTASIVVFACLGLIVGLPAGAIMSLPARILPLSERVRGMGYFYTVFYAVIVLSPILAGYLSVRTGSTRIAFLSSGGFAIAGLVSFAALVLVERCWQPRAAVTA